MNACVGVRHLYIECSSCHQGQVGDAKCLTNRSAALMTVKDCEDVLRCRSVESLVTLL